MKCQNCGYANRPGDRFCERCGMPLTQEAGPASAGAPPTAAFPLPPPSPPPAPTRTEYIYSAPTIANPTLAGPSANPVPPAPAYTTALPSQPWQPPVGQIRPVGRRNGLALLAVGGAILLLLVAAGALYLVSRAGRTALPAVAPVVGGFKPASAQDREIIAAVEANNNAQIAALHSLDAHALDGKMTGQALAENQASLQTLKSQGVYQDARLLHIDYQQPKVQGTNRATIATVEQWDSTSHDLKDGSVTDRQSPQTLHEVYYLVRQNGQWLVTQVDILEEMHGTPSPGP